MIKETNELLITVALIYYTNKQQDFSAFITFSSQGSSCPSPTHLCFFTIQRCCAVDQEVLGTKFSSFRHNPPPSTLICHYLLLFVTIRDYSRLFATIRTIRTIRDYSLFGIRDCSLFAIWVFQTPVGAVTAK